MAMTYDPIIEAKKKRPAINPAANVLGRKASPEVEAEVDRMLKKVIANRKANDIKPNEYTEDELMQLYREEPTYTDDMDDIQKSMDAVPKVDTGGGSNGDGTEGDGTEEDEGMTPEKEKVLNRMKAMMGNMTLKQIKFLKDELRKGIKQ